MAEPHTRPPQPFTLRMRRYDPESGQAPYWQEHTIELEPHRSVLEGILQARDRFDGSIAIRCSCRQAICGSCGVRVNGEPALDCHTHLDAALRGAHDGVIEIEPMGNMPVIKDLIVDMDAVHWRKVQRVTPWLLAKQPVPEREYLVPREAMVDVTQTMACIQCGACVSDCLASSHGVTRCTFLQWTASMSTIRSLMTGMFPIGSISITPSCAPRRAASRWVWQSSAGSPLTRTPQEPQITWRQEQRIAIEPSKRSRACRIPSSTERWGSSSIVCSCQ